MLNPTEQTEYQAREGAKHLPDEAIVLALRSARDSQARDLLLVHLVDAIDLLLDRRCHGLLQRLCIHPPRMWPEP
jgi:hypothetical protein